MPGETLRVHMLGDFSITSGDSVINSGSDRSKKIWLLIAYLIYRRGSCATPEEMIQLLWGKDVGVNPMNALKTLFHRARLLLDRLDGYTGHDLLLRQEGGYAWNAEVPLEVDVEQFSILCHSAAVAEDLEERLAYLKEAVALYHGSFLEKLSSALWVLPIAAHYHALYIDCSRTALALLECQSRWREAAALCRATLKQEPCSEEFCQGLMGALNQMEDYRSTVEAYAVFREQLMADLGVAPSEGVRELYQAALQATVPQVLSPAVLLGQLQESPSGGALICDYDLFRTVYHVNTRMSERNGDAAHLVLLSVAGPLSAGSLNRVMEHIQELLRLCLRRGDVAARCSAAQYVILLPQANYENSQMICDRIKKAFLRQYPHSPARLQTDVQPLTPSYLDGETGLRS